MAFGKEIKRLRKAAGISVEKLAGKIGVNADRWRKWEAKDFDPRDEDQRKIESFLKIPISEISKLDSIGKFLKVPILEEQTKVPPHPIMEELTPGQLIAFLARTNEKFVQTLETQARMLELMQKSMAKEETLTGIKANLDTIAGSQDAGFGLVAELVRSDASRTAAGNQETLKKNLNRIRQKIGPGLGPIAKKGIAPD